MKIVVVGGGAGGLYAAILLRKLDPTHQITVFERNPPDATYGWGVVFSDETLGSLEAADEPTYRAISERFARWDSIEVRFRGEILRVGGNVFAGISRRVLLGILQDRCRELGVPLRFGQEVHDLAPFADADLIVAADGINSGVRRRFADHFRPSLIHHARKYVWLGTGWRPDAFTFICRETGHGLFQATIYPNDEAMSTFVVEVDEEPWRRAGLDRATEAETLAYCEKAFADDLQGHRLLSNRSEWLNFATIRNATWHHGRIVLLGDAAHTAHYTIGSGTKLAMEDAIALAEAMEHTGSVEAALTYYEQGREPVVERIQEAARESYAWYEALGRYAEFEPIQFAFAFFTRSGRITYDNLRVRDPRFVDAVDRWFAGRSSAAKGPVVVAPPPMFTPLRLRAVTLLNRAVLAAPPTDSAEDGVASEAQREHLLARATGGAGLVLSEFTAVSADGRVTPGDAGLYRPAHAAAWKAVVERVRATSLARIGLRLGHAGRRGSTRPRGAGLDRPLPAGHWELLAPSPIPYLRESRVPRAMDRDDLGRVRDDFARAARWAAEAGFDLLHLDFAHGYLLASFLSPLTNRRTDEFGGALEDRLRFPLEVFDAVRAAWPAERPLAVCLSATDWAPGGFEPGEAVRVAATLRDHGGDLLEVVAGQTTPQASPSFGRYFLTPFSDQIRNSVGITTMTRGNITTPDEVNTIVAAGRADLCVIDPVV